MDRNKIEQITREIIGGDDFVNLDRRDVEFFINNADNTEMMLMEVYKSDLIESVKSKVEEFTKHHDCSKYTDILMSIKIRDAESITYAQMIELLEEIRNINNSANVVWGISQDGELSDDSMRVILLLSYK